MDRVQMHGNIPVCEECIKQDGSPVVAIYQHHAGGGYACEAHHDPIHHRRIFEEPEKRITTALDLRELGFDISSMVPDDAEINHEDGVMCTTRREQDGRTLFKVNATMEFIGLKASAPPPKKEPTKMSWPELVDGLLKLPLPKRYEELFQEVNRRLKEGGRPV